MWLLLLHGVCAQLSARWSEHVLLPSSKDVHRKYTTNLALNSTPTTTQPALEGGPNTVGTLQHHISTVAGAAARFVCSAAAPDSSCCHTGAYSGTCAATYVILSESARARLHLELSDRFEFDLPHSWGDPSLVLILRTRQTHETVPIGQCKGNLVLHPPTPTTQQQQYLMSAAC